MHLDSSRTIKCVLAGTATSKFTDVLEAVFGIDEENPPEFEEEEDEPDTIPEEGLTTKETVEGESLLDPVASTSVGVGAKCKASANAPTVKSPNINLANRLKAECAPLQMQPFSILLIQVPTSTLMFLVNTSLNEKVVSTSIPRFTCVITQESRMPGETKFLLVTLCVKINRKFLPTFDNFTLEFV